MVLALATSEKCQDMITAFTRMPKQVAQLAKAQPTGPTAAVDVPGHGPASEEGREEGQGAGDGLAAMKMGNPIRLAVCRFNRVDLYSYFILRIIMQ